MDTLMTTPSPQQDHAYPVDVEFPDLSPYAAGNTGIPYVYTFDSGVDGPHVMINALTHGNEVCGAIAVKALLDLGVKPRRGKLTLGFSNVDAYLSFDAAKPDASRFVDQDFNRVWTAAKLDDASVDSSELRRARALRPVIDTVDFLLDLHSMHERSAPLIVSGSLDKGIELARALGAPGTVISDEGHPEGRRMRDYEGFGDPLSSRNALLVECGQHWEPSAVVVAKDCTARFLVLAGALDVGDLPADWFAAKPDAIRVIRVTQPVVAKSMDFRFADAFTGLETFAKAGTVIGWNEGEPVVTPYDNCVLVMPSLRQLRPGVTVVRLGQLL
jgi:predicted deacylase